MGLDGAPNPEVFGRIGSITSDPSGRIYVTDVQAREIRVFGEDGEHLYTFGRQGQGPGEFGSLNSLTWLGDMLYVLDPGNARIQKFREGGVEAGTVPWLRYTGLPDLVRFFPASDGRLHTPLIPPRLEGGGIARGRAYLTFEGDQPVDSVFVPFADPNRSAYIICMSPEIISEFSNPLIARELATPKAAGQAWHISSNAYELHALTAEGDTVVRIIREGANRPVPDARWQEVEDSLRAFRERLPPGVTCEPASLGRPAAMPVIAGVHYTAEGTLVVEVETDEGYAFDFHDEENRLVATALAPPRDRRVPPHFRGDRLYVVTRGEFDVPGVAVFRVVRAGN
jgi:hypothetical protein